jgi:hypothetical protein
MEQTPAQDVSAASSTATDDYSFLGSDGNVVGTEDSSSSEVQANQEPVQDSNPEDSAPVAVEAPVAETAKPKDAVPPGFKRRIDKLTAKAKQAEEQSRQLELEVAKYRKAFELMNEQYAAKESRLAQLEEADPIVAENERLKLEQKIGRTQQELEKEWQQKVKAAEHKARVSAMADQILEEVEQATTRFPTVSNVELAMAIKQNPGAPVMTLAQQIHQNRYKALEQEFTAKYRGRTNAPKPISAVGSTARRGPLTDQDLIAELDAALGEDWNQIR